MRTSVHLVALSCPAVHRSRPVLLLVLPLALSACTKTSPPESPKPPEQASEKAEPKQPPFSPPADGRVTPQQIEDYLRALEKARETGATATPASLATLSSPAGEVFGGTPDVAAARELGLRIEEFLWVRERVLEALAMEAAARLDRVAIADVERTLGDLKARLVNPADDGSRKVIENQITIFTEELGRLKREAARPLAPAIRANIETVAPFREKALALQESVIRLPQQEPASTASEQNP